MPLKIRTDKYIADKIRAARNISVIMEVFQSLFPDVSRAMKRGFDFAMLSQAVKIRPMYEQFKAAETPERRFDLARKLMNVIDGPHEEAALQIARIEEPEIRFELSQAPSFTQIGEICKDNYSLRAKEAARGLDLEGSRRKGLGIQHRRQDLINKWDSMQREITDFHQPLLDDLTEKSQAASEEHFKVFDQSMKESLDAKGMLLPNHKEIQAKYAPRLKELEAKRDQALKDLEEAQRACVDDLNKLKHDEIDEGLKQCAEEMDAVAKEFHTRIVDEVLQASPISEAQAEEWANTQEVTKSAERRLKRQGYAIEDVRKDMAEFYRLSGGRLPHVSVVTEGRRRACAWMRQGKVSIDSNFSKRTLFHEMAHLLENDTKIKAMAQTFLLKRCEGKPIRPLNKLDPGKAYKRDEVAYEDDFFSPYVGKVYGDGVTEIMSMGCQMFSNPKALARFHETDPEMFNMIYGTLLSPPDLDTLKETMEEGQKVAEENARNQAFFDELKKKSKSGKFLEGREDRVYVTDYTHYGRKRPSTYYVHIRVGEADRISERDDQGRPWAIYGLRAKTAAYAVAYLALIREELPGPPNLTTLIRIAQSQQAPNWYKTKNEDSMDRLPEIQ